MMSEKMQWPDEPEQSISPWPDVSRHRMSEPTVLTESMSLAIEELNGRMSPSRQKLTSWTHPSSKYFRLLGRVRATQGHKQRSL